MASKTLLPSVLVGGCGGQCPSWLGGWLSVAACSLWGNPTGFWSPRVLQPGSLRVFCGFLFFAGLVEDPDLPSSICLRRAWDFPLLRKKENQNKKQGEEAAGWVPPWMASLFSSSLDLIKRLHFYRRWRSLMAANKIANTWGRAVMWLSGMRDCSCGRRRERMRRSMGSGGKEVPPQRQKWQTQEGVLFPPRNAGKSLGELDFKVQQCSDGICFQFSRNERMVWTILSRFLAGGV